MDSKLKRKIVMPKFNYKHLEITAKKKQDIQFNFAEVQTKNPRTQCKTPVYLFTKDPLPQLRAKKKWWE